MKSLYYVTQRRKTVVSGVLRLKWDIYMTLPLRLSEPSQKKGQEDYSKSPRLGMAGDRVLWLSALELHKMQPVYTAQHGE